MIKIYLDNKLIEIEEKTSLKSVLENFSAADNFFAIALNRQFIPRIDYSTTYLSPSDEIEIIVPMQGG